MSDRKIVRTITITLPLYDNSESREATNDLFTRLYATEAAWERELPDEEGQGIIADADMVRFSLDTRSVEVDSLPQTGKSITLVDLDPEIAADRESHPEDYI